MSEHTIVSKRHFQFKYTYTYLTEHDWKWICLSGIRICRNANISSLNARLFKQPNWGSLPLQVHVLQIYLKIFLDDSLVVVFIQTPIGTDWARKSKCRFSRSCYCSNFLCRFLLVFITYLQSSQKKIFMWLKVSLRREVTVRKLLPLSTGNDTKWWRR